jgi:hypothetical protein
VTLIIEAEHPRDGRLFAAVAPEVKFTEGGVRPSRMGAMLAPFRSQELALAAIAAAGAKLKEKA